MKSRSVSLLLIAGLLAAGAAWVANQWAVNRNLAVTAVSSNQKTVVVAALDIPYAQKVEEKHLKMISMPSSAVPAESFSDTESVLGKVAAEPVLKGDILRVSRFAEHLRGTTLATLIDPEKRAITLRVNDVIGVAGFLLPGDYVDVLATTKKGERSNTSTILRAIKILAVDQTASTNTNDPVIVRAVTLEVEPKEAEMLVKARSQGSLQLALRNPNTVDEAVVQKPAKIVRRNYGSSITVIRGTDVSVVRQ